MFTCLFPSHKTGTPSGGNVLIQSSDTVACLGLIVIIARLNEVWWAQKNYVLLAHEDIYFRNPSCISAACEYLFRIHTIVLACITALCVYYTDTEMLSFWWTFHHCCTGSCQMTSSRAVSELNFVKVTTFSKESLFAYISQRAETKWPSIPDDNLKSIFLNENV